VFEKATAGLDKDHPPSKVEGHRNVLLVARPVRPVMAVAPPTRTNRAGGGTSVSASAYRAAKAEYDSALAAYEAALKKLENARLMSDVSSISTPGLLGSVSKTDQIIGTIGALSAPANIRNAEREVEIARQQLERARAKLNTLEWKQ